MAISRFADAAAFLGHAGPLLRQHAIDNNVMLGIAGGLVDESGAGALMLTADEAGEPRIAGLMTPARRLIVSTGSTGAIPALVEGSLADPARPPGVVGPTHMVDAFAAAWRETTGETATLADEMNLLIAMRSTLSRDGPGDVPGRLRAATAADADWVADAFAGFAAAIDAAAERDESRTAAVAYLRRRQVFLWDIGGVPVSMACSHRMAPDGARVGPVYTPPAGRGQGYASAAVATLTGRILDDGAAWCAIFAAVGNTTTNAIYRGIGYNGHGTYREYDFAPTETG